MTTPAPFRASNAPFRTDVVRRTALSTATLLRTGKAGGAFGGYDSTAAADEGLGTGTGLSETQLAKLEENVNLKIDKELDVLVESFWPIVGLAMIRDKDKYVIAQESYQAEMRAHNMVRAAQSLTLLSASLKLSLILSLESAEQGIEDHVEQTDNAENGHAAGRPMSARELIEDTERLRSRCASLLGNLGAGLGHPLEVVPPATTDSSSETASDANAVS